MEIVNSKSKVVISLFWKLMERGGTQGIQVIVQIILARLLLPEDYGIIALVVIFINLANVFVESGFSSALIQKKDADEIDFSSVFYLSLCVAFLLFIILFFIAPVIARFFETQMLIPVLRVLSLILFFGVINSIQNAIIARNMDFKKLFLSSTISNLVSGTIGIAMAYMGFGVWALVGQQLTNQVLVSLILWFTLRWRPSLMFSFPRIKSLFSFGWKLLVSSLIITFYLNLRSLIIGKMYNPTMLSFYTRGQQFPEIIAKNMDGSMQSVMFPLLSSHQDDKPKVKSILRRSLITGSFITFPMMVGLAATAEPLIRLLLTEKWLPVVPFLQMFCVIYILIPVYSTNLQAIKALGRSDIFLKLEIYKKSIELIILGVSVFHGVYAIALGQVLGTWIATLINIHPNKALLDYGILEQCKDIMPSFLLSLVMGMVVYSIQWFGMASWLTLLVQVCVGIVFYLGMAWIFKLECFSFLIATIREVLLSNKKIACEIEG